MAEALRNHEAPGSVWDCLDQAEALDQALPDFLIHFKEVLRGPDIRRATYETARLVFEALVYSQLVRRGLDRSHAEDATILLLDGNEPHQGVLQTLSRVLATLRQPPAASAAEGFNESFEALLLSPDDVREALTLFFKSMVVQEAIAAYDPPARLPKGLEQLGYAQKSLSELLLTFPEAQIQLLGLRNLGRRSVRALQEILTSIVTTELQRQGFSSSESADAGVLLIESAQLDDQKITALAERLRQASRSRHSKLVSCVAMSSSIEPTDLPVPPRPPEKLLKELLDVLDARDRDVLERRYGLLRAAETLEEIGQAYKVTRERIRQIESRALGKLKRRASREMVASLAEHCQSVWDLLADGEAYLLASDFNARRSELPGWIVLCFEVAELRPDAWLDRHAHPADAGWFQQPALAERVAALQTRIAQRILDRNLPCIVQDLANEGEVQETNVAVRMLGQQTFGDYVLALRPTRRVRRAIHLHHILGAQGPLGLGELVSLYRRASPGDSCSFRDAEISMQNHRHLFIETVDGFWSAVGKPGAIPDQTGPTVPWYDETTSSPTPEVQTEDGTIAAALEKRLRAHGPARLGELVQDASSFLPQGRSTSSLGPILLTVKDRFIRPLPGIYALPDQVPGCDQLLRSPPAYIFQEEQVRMYALARRAGERWGNFPLWLPEVEFLWARWALRNAEPALLESLLSIIDVDAWPESVDDKTAWRDLKASRAQFSLQYPPSLESVGRPELERLFAACVYIRHQRQIGWMSANRVLWRHVTYNSSAGLLAALVALDVLLPADDWQLPHLAGPRLDSWLARLEARWSRSGCLSWDDDLGQELVDYVLRPTSDCRGWIEQAFLNQMFDAQRNLADESPSEVDPLQQLLGERAQLQHSAQMEAILQELGSDSGGDVI